MKHYHLELMLSSGTTCYHLGLRVIIRDAMLSSGANVIIWDKMLSTGANVIMVSSGAIVIIWCYHVMLSSGMITHPFFIFPENFTHSQGTSHFIASAVCMWSSGKKKAFDVGGPSSIDFIYFWGSNEKQQNCDGRGGGRAAPCFAWQ